VVEVGDPDLDDDMIELNSTLHIQVHCDWMYGTVVEETEPGKYRFGDTHTLDRAVTEANKIV